MISHNSTRFFALRREPCVNLKRTYCRTVQYSVECQFHVDAPLKGMVRLSIHIFAKDLLDEKNR